MITPDTNILVRYLVKDDATQTIEATRLLEKNECYVQQAVLLETIWVLSSGRGYNWERQAVVEHIRQLFSLPGILVQRPATAAQALDWYLAGMDFADALHLANTEDTFVTFDKRLYNKAKQLGISKQIMLPGKEIH